MGLLRWREGLQGFVCVCVCAQMYYVCALVYSSDIETVSDELAGRVSTAQQDLKARNREQWLVLVEICHEGLLLFQRLRRWFPRSFGVMSLSYFPHAHCYNSQFFSACFGRQQSSTSIHTPCSCCHNKHCGDDMTGSVCSGERVEESDRPIVEKQASGSEWCICA